MSYRINNVSVVPPVGSVVSYTGATAPNGWLLCDGTVYSRTTYSALYNVIGTAYNTATTSDTDFNVPNFQAAFLRGAGIQQFPKNTGTIYGYNTNSVNPTVNDIRQINTAQGTTTQTHTHPVTSSESHSHVTGNQTHTHTSSDTNHTHSSPYTLYRWVTGQPYTGVRLWFDTPPGSGRKIDSIPQASLSASPATNPYSLNVSIANSKVNTTIDNSSAISVTSISSNAGNNTESLPFNYAINWIIKY